MCFFKNLIFIAGLFYSVYLFEAGMCLFIFFLSGLWHFFNYFFILLFVLDQVCAGFVFSLPDSFCCCHFHCSGPW